MSATTEYVLTAPLDVQQGEQAGVFGIVNRSTGSQVVTILVFDNLGGQETITLVHTGDSTTLDLGTIRSIQISADSYPCNILLLNTNLGIGLSAAPVVNVAPAPPGAVTFHADLLITTATTTTLYTPTAGKRFVLTSVIISTDGAQRVMVVDDADSAGQRLVGGYFAANGGIAIPGEWSSGAVNRVAKVVTGAIANCFVSVEGYESA